MEAITIHQETGLRYSDFIIYTKFEEQQFKEAFQELIPSGKTIAIKKRSNGTCFFITEKGCSIFPLRSFICRVFPFWYDQEIYKATGDISLIFEERECSLLSKMLEFNTLEEKCRFLGNTGEEIKELFRISFRHYELANLYQNLFENMNIDDAFEEIEKEIHLTEILSYQQHLKEDFLLI